MKKRGITILAASATALLSALSLVPIAHGQSGTETKSFRLLEATIDDIHGAYKSACESVRVKSLLLMFAGGSIEANREYQK